ncbi:hypothetical protein [Paenibacillus sp. GbtcB18]|nr:hypothetical protein [Paenibacillus sp. GbtcB18]
MKDKINNPETNKLISGLQISDAAIMMTFERPEGSLGSAMD